MKQAVPSFLLTTEKRSFSAENKDSKHNLPFIDRTLKKMAGFIHTGYLQGTLSSQKGYLQNLDARIKIIFLICFLLLISLSNHVFNLFCISLFFLVLYIFSHIPVFNVYKKIVILSFFFGFLVFAPAALNLVTPGKPVVTLAHFSEAKHFWIYQIPQTICITKEGLLLVLKLYLRVINSLTLSFLVICTTPFVKIIKALKILKVPDTFLLIITLTYKFIFILTHTVQETYFALKLRWWKKVSQPEANKIVAGRIAYLFHKSWLKYEEVFMAMTARGFSGEINFCYLEKLQKADFIFLILMLSAGIMFYLI
jgi:cobalt/nickel transport system permease protein